MAWRWVDLLSVSDCLLPLLHFVAADVVTFRHTQLLHIYFICLGVAQFNMLYNIHISPMGLDTKLANYILTGKPVDFTLDTLLQFFFCKFQLGKKKILFKEEKNLSILQLLLFSSPVLQRATQHKRDPAFVKRERFFDTQEEFLKFCRLPRTFPVPDDWDTVRKNAEM